MLVPVQPQPAAFAAPQRPSRPHGAHGAHGKQPSLSIQDRHVAPKGAPKSYGPPKPESRRLKDPATQPCQSARPERGERSERNQVPAQTSQRPSGERAPASRTGGPCASAPAAPGYVRERSPSMIKDPEGKLCQIFEAVDVNRDGSINKREMIKFCRSSPAIAALLGFPEGVRQEDGSRDVLERRFQAMDRDDDREVTLQEFLDFFLPEMSGPPQSEVPPEPEPEFRESRGPGGPGLRREDSRPEATATSQCSAAAPPVSYPALPPGPTASPTRKYPRVPVDEAFERAFEQKHQEWLKQDEKMRLAEEEARQAGVRAVQRLLEELSDNPFELIPRASELSAEALAEHLDTEDVAQTLRTLHKESARNLERLKFHVRLSSEEHGNSFPVPMTVHAASASPPEAENDGRQGEAPSNVPLVEATAVPCIRPPSWSGDLRNIGVDKLEEVKAPAWAVASAAWSRPVSTPDMHRDGLEAPWAVPKPTALENGAAATAAPNDSHVAIVQERQASVPSVPRTENHSASGAAEIASEIQEIRDYKVGSYTLAGKKRCMEDWKNQDSCLMCPLGPTKLLVGVFDGHGEQGHEVSASVAKLFAHFAEDLEKLTEAAPMEQVLPRQMANLFSLAQDGLRRGGLAEWSGTTATLAMIDTEAGSVVCAYVGDSRMAIAHNQRVLFATNDHDVDDDAERRVTAAGGEVRRMWVSGIDARRVFLRGLDIPGLSMSRALGDLQASAVGVLNEPSIHTCVQIPKGSAVILASDGLWEKVTTQEVAAVATAAMKLRRDGEGASGATVAAKALVSEARSRWIQEGGDVDDITAVVVQLGNEAPMELVTPDA